LNFVKENINTNLTIAAICGATIGLAHKGFLNEIKHTSNSLDYLKMICPAYKGEKYFLNQPVVIDNNIITATGLAPLEFSYETLKKINIMEKSTINAWYNLYKTREDKYFFELMESIK